MTRLLADENFHNDVLRGLLRADPTLEIIRVQDTPHSGAPDPDVLAWAAEIHAILLTHDVSTMTDHAYARVREEQPMPGVILVVEGTPTGRAISEILIVLGASTPEEMENRVVHIPLR